MTHSGYDRLLMGSPLRRSGVSKAIAAALLVILAFATLVQLVVFEATIKALPNAKSETIAFIVPGSTRLLV